MIPAQDAAIRYPAYRSQLKTAIANHVFETKDLKVGNYFILEGNTYDMTIGGKTVHVSETYSYSEQFVGAQTDAEKDAILKKAADENAVYKLGSGTLYDQKSGDISYAHLTPAEISKLKKENILKSPYYNSQTEPKSLEEEIGKVRIHESTHALTGSSDETEPREKEQKWIEQYRAKTPTTPSTGSSGGQ